MSSEQLLNFKPRLGIRSWRIDISYFYILAFLGIILGLFIESGQVRTPRSIILWSISKGVSFVVLYLFWKNISILLIQKGQKTISSISILAIGAVGGLIQGIVVEFFIKLFLIENTISVASRLSSSAIFAAFWLPAYSVTAGNFTKFRNMREALHEQIAEMGSVDLARQRLFAVEKELLDQKIDNLVVKASDSAQEFFDKAIANKIDSNLPTIARSLASDHLRLLAHKITDIQILDHSKGAKRFFQSNQLQAFLQAFHLSLRSRPLNPEWFTLIIVITVSLPLLRRSDYPVNILALVIIGISTYLIQQLSYWIRSRINRFQGFQTLITVAVNILLPFSILHLIPKNETKQSNLFAFGIVVIAITIIGHLAQAGLLRQNDLLQSEKFVLEKMKIDSEIINMELARTCKKWAKHIHGNLQSKLHAYALVLEHSQKTGDTEGIEGAIKGISQVLKDFKMTETEGPSRSLGFEVGMRSSLWEGLIEIKIDIEQKLENLLLTNIDEIGECVNEAITNAVRHGGASKIQIKVLKELNFLKLQIIDNGVVPLQCDPGFGSMLFDSATGRNWKLLKDSLSNQTILTLTFDVTNNQ